MANGWTPERRARQAALIRTWKPWEQSTGPRTVDGKARAALNGDMWGEWRQERLQLRELKAIMRQHRKELDRLS